MGSVLRWCCMRPCLVGGKPPTMEEHQPQSPPHHPAYRTPRNRDQQPYSLDNADDIPLEEEANVVPIPVKPRSLENIAENALNPRPATKRKQDGSSQGKARSSTSKKSQPFRQYQGATQHPFADELQRLEAQAERINQILSERARKKTWSEQPPESSQPSSGLSNKPTKQQSFQPSQRIQAPQPEEWRPSAPLEDEETEDLKRQAKRIMHRLAELEEAMEEAESLTDAPEPTTSYENQDFRESMPPRSNSANPAVRDYSPLPPLPSQSQSWETSTAPRQRAEQDAWRAAEELRHLTNRERVAYQNPEALRVGGASSTENRTRSQPFDPTLRQPASSGRRSRWWRFLELPRKRADRIGDALLWIVLSATVRVGSQYLLASFPFLSPVLLFLMLTPAMLAVFLAIFVPRAGWVPIYRLLLIMLGLLAGGKL